MVGSRYGAGGVSRGRTEWATVEGGKSSAYQVTSTTAQDVSKRR